jgi:hypothetical protein
MGCYCQVDARFDAGRHPNRITLGGIELLLFVVAESRIKRKQASEVEYQSAISSNFDQLIINQIFFVDREKSRNTFNIAKSRV